MKEYIERNELLKHKRYTSLDRYEIECVVDVDKIIEAPAADVEEVIHGKWINAYPEIEPNPMCMYGICSNCGFEQSISDKLKYCPECGAKMDLK